MDLKIKNIVINGVLAGVYILLTLINPISYGIIQFRFSEILSVLPFFNKKYAPAIIVGVGIANMFSPLGFIDVVIGLLISCIMYYIVLRYVTNLYLNSIILSLLCGLFVGIELTYIFGGLFVINFLSVFLSQLVITFLGVIIIKNSKLKEVI